ncbi:hypothetical protein GQR58_026841 [Nymphon striatum]|nr:hypothetical protein GQR58_026841 [Nymphon striatum]
MMDDVYQQTSQFHATSAMITPSNFNYILFTFLIASCLIKSTLRQKLRQDVSEGNRTGAASKTSASNIYQSTEHQPNLQAPRDIWGSSFGADVPSVRRMTDPQGSESKKYMESMESIETIEIQNGDLCSVGGLVKSVRNQKGKMGWPMYPFGPLTVSDVGSVIPMQSHIKQLVETKNFDHNKNICAQEREIKKMNVRRGHNWGRGLLQTKMKIKVAFQKETGIFEAVQIDSFPNRFNTLCQRFSLIFPRMNEYSDFQGKIFQGFELISQWKEERGFKDGKKGPTNQIQWSHPNRSFY